MRTALIGKRVFYILLLPVIFLGGCSNTIVTPGAGQLRVVATTSIVADVVQNVGGSHVQLTTLLPRGADPHTFEPRPQDAAALQDASLVFANGAGLEELLQPLFESAGVGENLVEVSSGIELLQLEDIDHAENPGGVHEDGDPHTWMNPKHVMTWVDNITKALSAKDPEHGMDYEKNANVYKAELLALDDWIRSQVDKIPTDERKLVTDHAVFGYFAVEYGFEQLATITGSFSTNSAPSARDLAALEDSIKAEGVRAIFIGESANQELASQVANDTGVRLVMLYHASLTTADGPAPTYLEYMRYNVSAIVDALK